MKHESSGGKGKQSKGGPSYYSIPVILIPARKKKGFTPLWPLEQGEAGFGEKLAFGLVLVLNRINWVQT